MHEGDDVSQKLLEKAYFIFKLTGPAMAMAMVRPVRQLAPHVLNSKL